MNLTHLKGCLLLSVLTMLCVQMFNPARAADTNAAAQLKKWSSAAGVPEDMVKGERLFNQKHGDVWSCAFCHKSLPTVVGKHASTSKSIQPLPLAFNALERLHHL